MADNFNKIFTKVLQQVGNQLVKVMRENLRQVVGRSSGALAASIQSTVVDTPKGPAVQISMLPYGPVLDAGRGPSRNGNKKVQAWRGKIVAWQSIKGIAPRQGMTPETLAFLITRKINKEGYDKKPFIQKSFDQVINQDLPGIFNTALDQAANNTFVNDIKITLK
jgi:hypothetical protein